MDDVDVAEVITLSSPDDCASLCRVLADVWGFTEASAVASSDTLRAMTHSGCYVAGVVVNGNLVGGGFGWPTNVEGEWRLHSHVIGFLEGYRALGLGSRIKHHQRDFARDRGLAAIEWTYDPLHAPNARFNLAKLGARVQSFHRDFYGEMRDTFSAGLGSDRFLVRWGVDDGPHEDASTASPPPSILDIGPDGAPVIGTTDSPTVRARIPVDIVGVRRVDSSLAIAWRDAFAATVGAEMQRGATVIGMSTECAYLIDRRAERC